MFQLYHLHYMYLSVMLTSKLMYWFYYRQSYVTRLSKPSHLPTRSIYTDFMQLGGLLLTQVYVLPNEKFRKHCHVENGWAWLWIRVLYSLWFFFSCDQFTASFIPFPAQSHVFPLTKKMKDRYMYKFQMEEEKNSYLHCHIFLRW